MGNEEQAKGIGYVVKEFPGQGVPESYHGFIIASWLKTFRYGNDYMRLVDQDHYFEAYKPYILHVLNKSDTKIRLAVLSDDHDVTLGFACTTGKTLHYAYVGIDYRNQGIGTKLIPKDIEDFTHITKIGLKLWPKKAPMAKLRPFK